MTVTVNVLDYYNKPEYYRFMDPGVFSSLEEAYLNNNETVELPADLFNDMIEKYENRDEN